MESNNNKQTRIDRTESNLGPKEQSRRKLLTGLTLGAGGALLAATSQSRASTANQNDCEIPESTPNTSRFPQHAIVFDQHGRKLRFYQDLVKNKVVMVQFMSTRMDGDHKTADNLAKMQRILGPRLGQQAHLISVTVEPEYDTVERLAEFAAQHGAAAGWSFVTGQPDDLQSIRDALFFRPGGHHGHQNHDSQDCSMGLIRYGNDVTGHWGSVPTRTDPQWLAERLNWVLPKERIAQSAERAGPPVRKA